MTIVFRKNTLFDINWVIFLKEYFILLRGMCYNLISFSPFFLSGFNFLLDVGGAGWQASIRMVFASEHWLFWNILRAPGTWTQRLRLGMATHPRGSSARTFRVVPSAFVWLVSEGCWLHTVRMKKAYRQGFRHLPRQHFLSLSRFEVGPCPNYQ